MTSISIVKPTLAPGPIPIGCVVWLSDHSVGVVCRRGDEPLTPAVRVLYDPAGHELDAPVDVDLAEDERSIVEVVDPDSLQLSVSDHI